MNALLALWPLLLATPPELPAPRPAVRSGATAPETPIDRTDRYLPTARCRGYLGSLVESLRDDGPGPLPLP